MLSLTRIQLLGFAAAGALVALTTANTPARSYELLEHLGPVGPHEPILTTAGSKRVIAFYEPGNGRCDFYAVVWDKADAEADIVYSAVQVRISLQPRQIADVQDDDDSSLNLQCGDGAANLAIVADFVSADVAQ
jgi:hypothetical protein